MHRAEHYYRIMPGAKSRYADLCRQEGFIGGDWDIDTDLTGHLPEQWRDFNKAFIPVYLERNPGKSRVSAGLACGMLHTICKGMHVGDLVLAPDGTRSYFVGEVASGYEYAPGEVLPHRRRVRWYDGVIDRDAMSEALQRSTGSAGTVCRLTKYADEIDRLIAGPATLAVSAAEGEIEDPAVFVLEKHLEDFLVRNWAATELGNDYAIFEEDGELVGQQYPTDTGPLDILAVRNDRRELLVVELKKGRASDAVVGQVLRYMGYVQDELAEDGQSVRGVIIALDDDLRLRRAVAMVPQVDFYRYEISFTLQKT